MNSVGEDIDQRLREIAVRAFDIHDDPVPGFIAQAHQNASPSLSARLRDTKGRPFETVRVAYAVGLARTASKLGYATRIAEFERLPEPDYNPHLRAFLTQNAEPHPVAADWLAALCNTARLVAGAAHKEPYSPDTSNLSLFGHGLCPHPSHDQMTDWGSGVALPCW